MGRHLWKLKEIFDKNKNFAEKFNLDPVLAKIILNRGISEDQVDFFLNPYLEGLHSPYLLPEIKEAKARLAQAVSNREKVMVFGDYDVDGIVSLAIFNEFAKKFPGVFSFYIPHRVKEGYGLNLAAVKKAKESGISLIVTFDCGVNSFQEIEYAKSLGIDTIVIDHHLPQSKLPEPIALINPKRLDSNYPFTGLTAGGLAFKFLQVMEEKDCYQVLDLVALSIVCDVAPLLAENRVLLRQGIDALRKSRRPAIRALSQVSKIKQEAIDTFHIGFILGPRVNASGRIAHAEDALRLFLSDDLDECLQLALKLNKHNRLRKNIEKQILKEAEEKVKNSLCGEHALVVDGSGWHPGVLGIVASRLKDKYYRPSFVLSFNKGAGRGSGRSTEGIHLMKLLDKCSDFLTAYGGHRKAVGMELEEENLDTFRSNINLAIQDRIKPESFLPVLEIDAKLTLAQIDMGFVKALDILYPYGEANPRPLFLAEKLTKKKDVQRVKSWYSVWLTDKERVFEATTYSKDLAELLRCGKKLDVVFSLDKNTYHNHPRLVLRDCRFA